MVTKEQHEKENERLLKEFANLGKKLGKVPNKREAIKFICSQDKIEGRFGSFNKFKELATEKSPFLKEVMMPAKLVASDLEDYRISLEKKKVKKHNQTLVQNVSSLDYIKQFAENTFAGKIKPLKKQTKKSKIKRVLNVVISDTHFGADLNKEETGTFDYRAQQEARRMSAIVQQVCDYKPQYRKETHLEVLLIGDIIQGALHSEIDGAPVAEQVCRAIHILSQALAHLANEFPTVSVRCATGNHGRRSDRHKNRAVHQKWDSYETIVYYSLKTALKDFKNVTFDIPKTPYGVYEVFGQKVLYTHGDTFLNPGNVSNTIQIKSLELQLNKINASLTDKDEVKVAVCGHIHIASQTYLSNGATMITNGALIEPDEYAVSIGIVECQTGQMMFESAPGFAVGDTRFIRVDDKTDEDSSLDKIIKPWKSLVK